MRKGWMQVVDMNYEREYEASCFYTSNSVTDIFGDGGYVCKI